MLVSDAFHIRDADYTEIQLLFFLENHYYWSYRQWSVTFVPYMHKHFFPMDERKAHLTIKYE